MIAGATRPEQVEANVRAGLWQPTDDLTSVLVQAEIEGERLTKAEIGSWPAAGGSNAPGLFSPTARP